MARQERYIPEFVFDNLDNLKWEARSKGYTVKEVAIRIGVTPNFLDGIKNGAVTPTRNNYNKIAQVLGWEEWQ